MRRLKRRGAAFLAVSMAVALGAVGVAQAINAHSTVSFNFTKTPAGVIGGTLKQGKLNVHTHTTYSGSGTKTQRARLYFDKNFAFSPSSVPKCATNKVSGNITMKQAMSACRTALVGTGTAKANLATPGDIGGCVLAFNAVDGNPGRAGNQAGILLFTRLQIPGSISCANPGNNQNGNGSILLQAPLATNPGSTSPGGALPAAFYKGGKWLDFNNIPQTAPLSDFNVTVGKGAPGTSLTGNKANFVRAKCTKRSGSKKWVLRTIFKYNNGTPNQQVVSSKHTCR